MSLRIGLGIALGFIASAEIGSNDWVDENGVPWQDEHGVTWTTS